MAKKTSKLLDLLVFMVTPEDSTNQYPDSPFIMSNPVHMHRRVYHHVIKTIFWVLAAAAVSIMISQLR